MRLKTRTIAGGLVVVGIVAGSFLSGLVPGFGSGSGSGLQTSLSTDNGEQPAEPPSPAPVDQPESPEQEPVEQPVEKAPMPEVLVVRVDGHEYLIPADNKGGVRKAELAEVVKLAQDTPGNEDGIRVRILRHSSARLVAWSTLYDSLEQAGLKRDAITMPRELID